MVWFQCEDCGENLKKPKLPNHFRFCSAVKLSCIDCGEIFGQHSVQGHNQCITEAEKYGPKGQAKTPNSSATKPQKDAKLQPNVDINVGLSERPPWFCSLCNTKATSQQTLLLHADGKKHRAKARAFHYKQQPKPSEDSASHEQSKENAFNGEMEPKTQETQKPIVSNVNSDVLKGDSQSNKKRKIEASDEGSNGEVIQAQEAKGNEKKSELKKAKTESTKSEIKWKKLITSTLKSKPEAVLKLKKLKKLVLKSIKESGITVDEAQLCETLECKIHSSSRFSVDGKYVRLAMKDWTSSVAA